MTMVLFCDNKYAITMSKNYVFHSRIKHIKLKYHYIKEAIDDKEVMIKHVKIGYQLADIFIKALSCDKFVSLKELLRMTNKNIKGSVEINIFMIFMFLYFLC
jgi:formate/nitrite transporter FocA (FNT family)